MDPGLQGKIAVITGGSVGIGLTFFPGPAIAGTVFGLNMLGGGIRDLLGPRHAAYHR